MGHKGIKKGKGKSLKQKTTKPVMHQKKDRRTTRTLEVKGGLLGSRVS